MDELLSHGWRVYPAVAMMLAGAAVLGRAVLRCRAAWPRPLTESMQPLAWMRGFRLAVLGLALLGTGAAWLWQIGWLLVVSLVVVIEETLETSIAISALSREAPPSTGGRSRSSAGTEPDTRDVTSPGSAFSSGRRMA